MAFNQYSNRGMFLETLINQTAWYYMQHNICAIFKRSVPITFYTNDENTVCGKITAKAGSDYYGVYHGKMFDFEAKQTINPYFLLANIKNHQWEHLIKVNQFEGICFIVIHLLTEDSYYAIDLAHLLTKRHTTKLSLEWIHQHGFKMEINFPGILDLESYLKNKINQ